MSENKNLAVRVAVRCRPLVQKEINEGCQTCLTFVPNEPQVVLGANKVFTYDYAFGTDSAQGQIYETSVKGLVQNIFEGYNATVLAYGQTGSGKTYTMGGAYDWGEGKAQKGIIPRVIQDLFDGINERSEKYDFAVRVSYLEIYREELCDLMVPPASRVKDSVNIREDTRGGIKLTGLLETPVDNLEQTIKCLEDGSRGRTTGSTAMNLHSSRSHAIFTIYIDMTNKADSNEYSKSKFHLVDLAGSERVKKTHAEGERLKEGININLGLLALGNVISALGDETQKRPFIPYRDSKLTRILQDSLGGNSYTLMIACVSPADTNMEETLTTLNYANRVRKIKNKPIINRDPKAAEIVRLRAIVQHLENKLQEAGCTVETDNIPKTVVDNSVKIAPYKEAISRLEEENNKLKTELVNTIHQNTTMYEKIISLEGLNDKLKENLEKLKETTGLSISMLESNPEVQEKIRQIQQQITEMESINEENLDESMENDKNRCLNDSTHRRSEGEANQDYTTEDVLKEAQLKNKMYQLNDMLLEKENLLKEINSNNMTFNVFQEQHEAELKERERKIAALVKEKDELLEKLQSAKAALNSSKVGEQRRQRIKELESKISSMQRENLEQAKMLRTREASMKDSQRLAQEILELKRQRVTLMKQMRAENKASLKWKQQKEKEVQLLKAKERRQQAQFKKLEIKTVQQQAVLRRKAEEAAEANKRLKEALARQKSVAASRANKQERHNVTHQAKLEKWLDNELELVVSVEENRHYLQLMRTQRQELTTRLSQLQDELDGPPTKRKLNNNSRSEDADEHKQKLKEQLEEVRQDLKEINIQLAETQQRIVEADQDEKLKTRWEEVRTLMDARCSLQILLDKAVKTQVERLEEGRKVIEAQASLEERVQQMAELEQTLADLQKKHGHELMQVRQEAERRVAPLLQLLNQKMLSEAEAQQADGLVRKEIDRLISVKEELDMLTWNLEQSEQNPRRLTRPNRRGESSIYGGLIDTPQAVPQKKSKKTVTPVSCSPEEMPMTPFTPGMEDDEYADPSWKPSFPKKGGRRGQVSSVVLPPLNLSDNSSMDGGPPKPTTCSCKGDCSTRRCRCRRAEGSCSTKCGCLITSCANRESEEEAEEPVFEEGNTLENNENATSDLNSTFVLGSGDNSDQTLSDSEKTVSGPSGERKSGGVKRSSSGVPRPALADKANLPTGVGRMMALRSEDPLSSTDSSLLDSSDDFMDTSTLSSRKRSKKPFFPDLN